MSWWVSRKDRAGKSHLWIIDVNPMACMIAIGLLAAVIAPSALLHPGSVAKAATGMIAAGFVCVAISKVSLFRQGLWISWGPRLMVKRYAQLYKVGYVLIGTGAVLLLLVYNQL